MVDQVQHGLFIGHLHGRRVVHKRLVRGIALAHRSELLDQPLAEVATLAAMPVAAPADGVYQACIHLYVAVAAAEHGPEVDPRRIAIGRHSHDAVFAVEHLEAKVLGHRAVGASQRIGVVELLQRADAPSLADADKRRRVFALAIDAENGGVAIESGQVIGACRVRQVMRYRGESSV